ncbi:helix-turn-helix domain-containing protein [Micromonospora sp. WMMD718]|uniref:winged helix-turn-helix transcriptional regulator n=1 Tax=Micromonospora sp. WMMD718 TaxID=3016098 RepID=UPI002416D6AE|nr:helix-turn-helix domain-containing protein [Micromonospora sp. WMMD718]MDG4755744.1 helix-turn-helix domain-containing protein [Micromonospora sp. WMMD718]
MHSFQRVYDAVRLCGHRWSLEILTALQQGQPMRFTDLLHTISPAPSSKSLNEALRRLQEHGLVGHVEGTEGSRYALTEAGEELLPVLMSFMADLGQWLDTYGDETSQPSANNRTHP